MLKKKPAPHANHERWLVSYADFMTLLFAFFVVMYASSQADKQKLEELARAIGEAFQSLGSFHSGTQKNINGPVRVAAPSAAKKPADKMEQLRAELRKALAPEIAKNSVAINIDAQGLVISLREIGFFDSGSAIPKTEALPALERIANVLKQSHCTLRIEGHTDNIPIHTNQFDSNWELSTARATSMVKFFVVKHDFDAGLLSAAGYAEYHPVTSNSTAEGRGMNRRVDLVTTACAELAVPPPVAHNP